MTRPYFNETLDGVVRWIRELMVRWFDSTSSESSSEELPWAKDFVKDHPDLDRVYSVDEVYLGDRGLLILASHFKAFVFKRQEMYQFLTEALDAWVEDHTLPSLLVVKLSGSGKPSFGLDEQNDVCYWVVEGYHYKRKYSTGDGTPVPPSSNPLLPSVGVSTGTRRTTTAPGEVSRAKNKSIKP